MSSSLFVVFLPCPHPSILIIPPSSRTPFLRAEKFCAEQTHKPREQHPHCRGKRTIQCEINDGDLSRAFGRVACKRACTCDRSRGDVETVGKPSIIACQCPRVIGVGGAFVVVASTISLFFAFDAIVTFEGMTLEKSVNMSGAKFLYALQ